MRDQVERGEFLEDADWISGTENSDGAGEADVLGACSRGRQDHRWSGVEELGAVMFTDPEHLKADLVGEFDLLQQVLHALDGTQRVAGRWIRDGCGKAVDTNLQRSGSYSYVLLDDAPAFLLHICNHMQQVVSIRTAPSSAIRLCGSRPRRRGRRFPAQDLGGRRHHLLWWQALG